MVVWRDISSSEDDEDEPLGEWLTVEQSCYIYCADEFRRKAGLNHILDKWNTPLGYCSDCSGMDTPLYALGMLLGDKKDCIQYLSNSECNPAAQRFLRMNHPAPLQSKSDIFQKDTWQFRQSKVGIYAAGFPCTPFSSLHFDTSLLGEEQAKPMWETIRRIKSLRPAAGLLENVTGFKRVINIVMDVLHKQLPEYKITWVELDQKNMGSPTTRSRVYIILVLEELILRHAVINFEKFVADMVSDFDMPTDLHWRDLLLPKAHPVVKKTMEDRMRKTMKPGKQSAGWMKKHREWARNHKVTRASGTFSKLYPGLVNQLSSRRELKALDLHTRRKGRFQIANTSQSIHRMSLTYCDAPVPCLTPNCTFLLAKEGRFLCGLEALIMMGMPVDQIKWEPFSDRALMKLAGNGMHVRCVLAVLCIIFRAFNRQKLAEYLAR
ncbi:unnamed protein product [Cladocopium goreaui]|uniref:Modification methylase NgoBI n=1 Tax=Cladocopium goreaui TaxID=2562237 RepID=A0A9P1BS62_9DINO|nr:unnamed protein product [Cladocopium goreaui]CAI4019000.1 unnamed protein product [Cladocopium goreaui]